KGVPIRKMSPNRKKPLSSRRPITIDQQQGRKRLSFAVPPILRCSLAAAASSRIAGLAAFGSILRHGNVCQSGLLLLGEGLPGHLAVQKSSSEVSSQIRELWRKVSASPSTLCT